MTRGKRLEDIVTFKADESLVQALKGVPNRSEFIREAIMAALDGTCPVCRGTGTLTPNQKMHWKRFAVSHPVEECEECHELRLVCQRETTQHAAVDGECSGGRPDIPGDRNHI